jgi:hypothetical protein
MAGLSKKRGMFAKLLLLVTTKNNGSRSKVNVSFNKNIKYGGYAIF